MLIIFGILEKCSDLPFVVKTRLIEVRVEIANKAASIPNPIREIA